MKNDPVSNIRFVQLVENYPQVYNYTLDSYSNKQETEKAWAEIGKTLNETPHSCIEKWRIIRSGFCRALRTKPPSGCGADAKKPHYLAKYLQFLVPYLKSREQKGNFNNMPSTSKNNRVEELESEEDNMLSTDTLVNTPENNTTERDIECSKDAGQSEPSTPEIPPSFRRPGLKRKAVETKAFETSFVEFVTAKEKTLKESEENPDLLFFKSLLPEVGKLDDSTKMRFKMTVLSALNDLLHKTPSSSPSPFSDTSCTQYSTLSPCLTQSTMNAMSQDLGRQTLQNTGQAEVSEISHIRANTFQPIIYTAYPNNEEK